MNKLKVLVQGDSEHDKTVDVVTKESLNDTWVAVNLGDNPFGYTHSIHVWVSQNTDTLEVACFPLVASECNGAVNPNLKRPMRVRILSCQSKEVILQDGEFVYAGHEDKVYDYREDGNNDWQVYSTQGDYEEVTATVCTESIAQHLVSWLSSNNPYPEKTYRVVTVHTYVVRSRDPMFPTLVKEEKDLTDLADTIVDTELLSYKASVEEVEQR